jgi:small-conductance mechanosensitive channel
VSDTPPPYTPRGAGDRVFDLTTPDIGEPVTIEVVPAGPGPRRRTWRTVLQVLVAVLVAVPGALAVLTESGVDLPAGTTALIVGGTGALVVLVSAGQNAIDQHRGVG